MVFVLTQRALKFATIKAVRARAAIFGKRLPQPQIYYFAYGANLDIARFTRYGMNVEKVSVANLPGYRFRFGLPCEYLGKGYGDVAVDPEKEVWGLLFRIDRLSLFLLDVMEWKVMGQYRRIEAEVRTAHGIAIRAHVYQAVRPREGLYAPLGYQKAIAASARALGFPQAYIEEIEAVESREHFELDHAFSFLRPHRARLFAKRLGWLYAIHDRWRERICDLLRF